MCIRDRAGGALLVDLVYYWLHRFAHQQRTLWAAHGVHHSSEHYNLSTALRQSWSAPPLLLQAPPSRARCCVRGKERECNTERERPSQNCGQTAGCDFFKVVACGGRMDVLPAAGAGLPACTLLRARPAQSR
eukprot:1318702-Rhodomonas_salina.1